MVGWLQLSRICSWVNTAPVYILMLELFSSRHYAAVPFNIVPFHPHTAEWTVQMLVVEISCKWVISSVTVCELANPFFTYHALFVILPSYRLAIQDISVYVSPFASAWIASRIWGSITLVIWNWFAERNTMPVFVGNQLGVSEYSL